MAWWKAVSKTTTCGTPGNVSMATRMPSRCAGLCSGARGSSSSMAVMTSSVTMTGSLNRSPPCTTR